MKYNLAGYSLNELPVLGCDGFYLKYQNDETVDRLIVTAAQRLFLLKY
jgi:hypothetical protein